MIEKDQNIRKKSFWQKFNNSKKTASFISGGKYFWCFIGICFVINLITKSLYKQLPAYDSTYSGAIALVLTSLFMGFSSALGYSILFLLVGQVKINEFKNSVVEGGVGCTSIILLVLTLIGIVMVI